MSFISIFEMPPRAWKSYIVIVIAANDLIPDDLVTQVVGHQEVWLMTNFVLFHYMSIQINCEYLLNLLCMYLTKHLNSSLYFVN